MLLSEAVTPWPGEGTGGVKGMTGSLGQVNDIAAVSVVKNEASVIARSLAQLYALGVRLFVVADNQSTDDTLAVVEGFRAAHPAATCVVLGDPIAGHYQSRKVTALAKFAATYFPATFIYPFDADEFLFPPDGTPGDLSSLLAGDRWDYLTLNWMTCVEAEDSTVSACVEPAHLGKVVVRWNDHFVIEQGNHGVCSTVARRFSSRPRKLRKHVSDWRVLHLPVRSADQLKSKVVASHAANSVNPWYSGSHWNALFRAYAAHGDRVFDDLYNIIHAAPADGTFDRFCDTYAVRPEDLSYFADYAKPRRPLGVTFPR